MIDVIRDKNGRFLLVDGVSVSTESVQLLFDQNLINLIFNNREALELLKGQSFEDLPTRFPDIGIAVRVDTLPVDFISMIVWLRCDGFGTKRLATPIEIAISAYVSFDWAAWNNPWSVSKFRTQVDHAISAAGFEARDGTFNSDNEPAFMLKGLVQVSLDESIVSTLHEVIQAIEDLLSTAEVQTRAEVNSSSITQSFTFPEEVRAPCEQYLAFFAEFLHGLGLSATADITHDAGQVLFTVTPKDGIEALSIIREALSVYLEIASVHDVADIGSFADDIRIQQLVGNVQHLQSQLTLQRAIVATQDVTIARLAQANASLALSNESGNVLQRALNKPAELLADEAVQPEHIAGGLITIRPTEIYGVQLNLPGMVRMLRQRVAQWRAGRSDHREP